VFIGHDHDGIGWGHGILLSIGCVNNFSYNFK